MRLYNRNTLLDTYKIMIVDDDEGIIDSISDYLTRNGYEVYGKTQPLEALEELKHNKYDLLILDYFMSPIKGDDFVAKLREFDTELYVLLLTGYKDLAPPLSTIRAFDIQAYCEKSPRLDQLLLLIESGIKSISQMRRIQKYRDGLNNMLEGLPKVYQLKPLADIMREILNQMLTLTGKSDAFILIGGLSEEKWSLNESLYQGAGVFETTLEVFKDSIAPSLMGQMDTAKNSREAVLTEDGVFVPLISISGTMQGVVYIKEKPEADSLKLLEVFAGQAAASIQNSLLLAMLDRQTGELEQAYSAIKTNYLGTIEALRLAVDAKDEYTRGHSDRVSKYSELIAKKMGMDDSEVEILRISGIFHDIGKIGTSDEVLLKDSRLTDEEFEEIKEHPNKGDMILSAVSSLNGVAHIIRSHHERIDGCGYPDGLAGESIPRGARIICVADAYDAMMSDRKYRRKLEREAAIDQLLKGSGTQFDKEIVDCFIAIIEEKPEDVEAISNYI